MEKLVGQMPTLLACKMEEGCHEPRSVRVSESWKRPERASGRERSLADPLILACQASVLQNFKIIHLGNGSHHICGYL